MRIIRGSADEVLAFTALNSTRLSDSAFKRLNNISEDSDLNDYGFGSGSNFVSIFEQRESLSEIFDSFTDDIFEEELESNSIYFDNAGFGGEIFSRRDIFTNKDDLFSDIRRRKLRSLFDDDLAEEPRLRRPKATNFPNRYWKFEKWHSRAIFERQDEYSLFDDYEEDMKENYIDTGLFRDTTGIRLNLKSNIFNRAGVAADSRLRSLRKSGSIDNFGLFGFSSEEQCDEELDKLNGEILNGFCIEDEEDPETIRVHYHFDLDFDPDDEESCEAYERKYSNPNRSFHNRAGILRAREVMLDFIHRERKDFTTEFK